MILWAVIAFLVIFIDQLTKHLVTVHISPYENINVIKNVLEFVYVKNTGAAFSLFDNFTWLLGIFSITFCVAVVIYWIKTKPQNKLLCLSMTLLFSGALGNAIDRIFRQYVVDFIKTSFIDFPVFNVADIAITTGAVLLIIYIIIFDKAEGASHE